LRDWHRGIGDLLPDITDKLEKELRELYPASRPGGPVQWRFPGLAQLPAGLRAVMAEGIRVAFLERQRYIPVQAWLWAVGSEGVTQ